MTYMFTKTKNHFIAATLLVVLITVIGGTYPWTVFAESGDEPVTIADFSDKQTEYQRLKEQNQDFVGWIYVEGTKIDNPLMQSLDDPDFYIDKDFDGEYLKAGTLFISNISDIDDPSDVLIVFGHNMADGTMFGTLRRFEDSSFTENNNRIWVDNMKVRREFEVTHVMRIRVDVEGQEDVFPYYAYSDFESEADYNEFIDKCNEFSLYDTGKEVEFGDKFVILSTCEYTWDDGSGRLVVMGREVRTKDEMTTESAQTIQKEEPSDNKLWIFITVGAAIIVLAVIILLLNKRKKNMYS